MKILHVVPTYIPAWRYGGPIRSVHGLCKALVELGHDVDVYTTNVNGSGITNVPIGISVSLEGVNVSYFEVNFFRRIYYSSSMKKSLNQNIEKYDLVHIHSVFLWPTLCAARIARKHSIPYIISPRGMLVLDLLFKKSFLKKIVWILLFERKNIFGASCLHVTSKLEVDEIKKIFFIKSKKIINIPNGISKHAQILDLKEKYEYDERLKRVGEYILYVGRLSWKKGLDRLIKSMTHIRNVNLIIAGNDEENYTKVITKLIEDNKLENRIIIWGGVNEKQRSYLMQNAKLFVLTSYSENFGNVILEAMLERCPVALTEGVGLYEKIIKAQVGTHLSKSSKKIGKEINFALTIPEQLKTMSNKGYELVTNDFSWGSVAKQMDVAYQSIILSKK